MSNPFFEHPILILLTNVWLHARTSAARAVNRELVMLYWDIGRGIVEKQQTEGWGESVIERLAADLRAAFPNMRGFSAANLWRIRQFYGEYSGIEFPEQAVPESNSERRAVRTILLVLTKWRLSSLAAVKQSSLFNQNVAHLLGGNVCNG